MKWSRPQDESLLLMSRRRLEGAHFTPASELTPAAWDRLRLMRDALGDTGMRAVVGTADPTQLRVARATLFFGGYEGETTRGVHCLPWVRSPLTAAHALHGEINTDFFITARKFGTAIEVGGGSADAPEAVPAFAMCSPERRAILGYHLGNAPLADTYKEALEELAVRIPEVAYCIVDDSRPQCMVNVSKGGQLS
jgi:hypothetical protein